MKDRFKIKNMFLSMIDEHDVKERQRLTLESVLKNSFVITDKGPRFDVFSRRFMKAFNYVPTPYIGFFGGRKVDCLTYSHVGIVRTALIMGLPFVTIFEDDAAPMEGMENIFNNYISSFPPDARCLVLGHLSYRKRDIKEWGHWMSLKRNCRGVAGSHAYIVFRSAYEDLIFSCNKKLRESDRCWDYMSPVYVSFTNFFIQNNYEGSPVIHVCRRGSPKGYVL